MSQNWRTTRPGPDEHAPYYAGYIAEAPDGDLVATLSGQLDETLALLKGLSGAQGLHRYAPGKWSLKDVIQHVTDAERVFSYRLLRFARGDATDLPGFDENIYVPAAQADQRSLAQLGAGLESVRRATLSLILPLDDEAMARRGTANGKAISARALAWIIAGHERHHVQVIQDRYLA